MNILNSQKCFVAVIEQDSDVRESICELLAVEGIEAIGFCSDSSALHALQATQQPCVVLLEIGMPPTEGWEFLRRRHQYGTAASTAPVLAFSAHLGDMRMPAEISRVFPKPFSCEALLSALTTEMARLEAEQSLRRYA